MLKQILVIACILCITVLLLMYIFQRHLIYFPDRHTPSSQQFHAQDMSIITLKTKDNLSLKSWYKPATNNHPSILYLHGNAGHIGYRMPLVRQFIDSGLGVFLLEYRGYGGNRGSPSEKGFYEDAQTALNYLTQQGIKSQQLILYGESLGTGVATKLAGEHQVCAVILQSPFTSLSDLAHYHYPWILIKPWDQFNSLDRIKTIHAPLLIIHGTQDMIVPYTQGWTLFNHANEPKKMLTINQYGHNNLWNSNNFSEEIIRFIQKYCLH